MESVNVLVASSVGDEGLWRIAAVSPRVKLTDVSDFVSAELAGDFTSEEQFDALLAEAEVIYGGRFPQNVIARAPKLKWLHTMAAGADAALSPDIVKSRVLMTCGKGGNAVAVSETILERMLMFVKQAPLAFRLQQERRWERFMPARLQSKTVGILGLGNIGQRVARLAKAFGMRVIATEVKRRRARYVDMVLPPERLHELLSESDFVVITLPLTPETNKLIGEKELRVMKPTAYLTNTSRGPIVDEEALIRALDENWIAGAGLDVFVTEPLPSKSKIWGFPNVIVSPHVAGTSEGIMLDMLEIFCQNLGRYLSGKRLRNVINKKKGY